MKSIALLLLSFYVSTINVSGQDKPVFLGTSYEVSGSMGEDQIDTWKYRCFVFKTITPGIARPITVTQIYKEWNGKLSQIKNNQMFGANVEKITAMVNEKLKFEFSNQMNEDKTCYKEFYPVGINELQIEIDHDSIYFTIVWDETYMTNPLAADCIYPSTTAEFSLRELSGMIIKN